MYSERCARARPHARELGVDVLLLSTGADLPYLTGYEAMPLERLTMLVVLADRRRRRCSWCRASRPRGSSSSPTCSRWSAWDETDDPDRGRRRARRRLVDAATSAAIGDHTWARFVLDLQRALPGVAFRRATDVTGPLRVVKDAGRDRRAARRGERRRRRRHRGDARTRPFAGRAELDVHRELVERMLDGGHERANFAIVATARERGEPPPRPESSA